MTKRRFFITIGCARSISDSLTIRPSLLKPSLHVLSLLTINTQDLNYANKHRAPCKITCAASLSINPLSFACIFVFLLSTNSSTISSTVAVDNQHLPPFASLFPPACEGARGGVITGGEEIPHLKRKIPHRLRPPPFRSIHIHRQPNNKPTNLIFIRHLPQFRHIPHKFSPLNGQ